MNWPCAWVCSDEHSYLDTTSETYDIPVNRLLACFQAIFEYSSMSNGL